MGKRRYQCCSVHYCCATPQPDSGSHRGRRFKNFRAHFAARPKHRHLRKRVTPDSGCIRLEWQCGTLLGRWSSLRESECIAAYRQCHNRKIRHHKRFCRQCERQGMGRRLSVINGPANRTDDRQERNRNHQGGSQGTGCGQYAARCRHAGNHQ